MIDNYMLRWALAYAGAGFSVLPIIPGGKDPYWIKGICEHGVCDATKDPDRIRYIWKNRPVLGIGVACGVVSNNLLAIDYDNHPDDDRDGREVWRKNQKEFPETVTVLTPTDGIHEWFINDTGIKYKNLAGIRPGVDIRTDNGYVVAPPTIRAGSRYCFEAGYSPRDVKIAKLSDSPAVTRFLEDARRRTRANAKKITGTCKPTLSDQEIINRCKRRHSGDIFTRLYAGDISGYTSHSEADFALCLLLAFDTDRDFDVVNRIFRSSGLYRDKWERDDYRERTISFACSQCKEDREEYVKRKNREEAREYESMFLNE